MFLRSLLIAILGIQLYSVSAVAEPVTEPEPQSAVQAMSVADQIIVLSGLHSLNDQIRLTAQQVFEEIPVPHSQRFGIAQALGKRWTTERWQEKLDAAVAVLSESQQQHLLALLKQEKLAEIREMEAKAISVQASEEFKAYQQKVRDKRPSEYRLSLINQVDDLAHISDMIILMRKQAYAELQSQLPEWAPAEDWQIAVKQQTQEFLFYLFKRTNNVGLQDFIAQYKSRELQMFFKAVKTQITVPTSDVTTAN